MTESTQNLVRKNQGTENRVILKQKARLQKEGGNNMRKKCRLFLRVILPILLCILVCAGSILPVFAETAQNTEETQETEEQTDILRTNDTQTEPEQQTSALEAGETNTISTTEDENAKSVNAEPVQKTETKAESLSAEKEKESRTLSLIDTFLEARPNDVDEAETEKNKRKPAPADVAVDYVSYLMQLEEEESKARKSEPEMKGQNLIDNFINNEKGKIELKETPEYFPEIDESNGDENSGEENYFTETLARIYIKQGKYSQALEIIKRLNLNYPKKNAYFADQIRFIEKLIINNKNKNK